MKSRTTDPTTYASLPGDLFVSRNRYRAYHGTLPWLASFLPDTAIEWPIVGPSVKRWVNTKEHLMLGCLNPAKVLDVRTGLVASFTDLNCAGDRGSCVPAIRLFHERLDLIPGAVENGSRFAAACLYGGSKESRQAGRWLSFRPIVVDCLVDDEGACKYAFSKINEFAWQALEMGIGMLPPGATDGTHDVPVPEEIVARS